MIDDFDRVALPLLPDEADAPLVVDPDAVLACALPPQRFQPICRRNAQVIEAVRSVEHPQLPSGERLNLIRKATRHVAVPYALRLLVCEAPDHDVS